MGCGGSSLKDLSSQAKSAVSQATDTAQANGLEKAELLKTGKAALESIKENGVEVDNLKSIAAQNGIKQQELISTGKDILLLTQQTGGNGTEVAGQETDLLNNALNQSEKGLVVVDEGVTALDQNENVVIKEKTENSSTGLMFISNKNNVLLLFSLNKCFSSSSHFKIFRN